MKRKTWVVGLLGVVLSLFAAMASASVFEMLDGFTDLELVTVGNAGNTPDSLVMTHGTTDYGAVGYEYQIGKYQVTATQYTVFLNTVAKSDAYGLYNANMWSSDHGCKVNRMTYTRRFGRVVIRPTNPTDSVSVWRVK